MMEVVQALNTITLLYPTLVRNPQFYMELIDEKILHTYINRRIQFHEFEGKVNWPGNISISTKGLISMQFEKQEQKDWEKPITVKPHNLTKLDMPKSFNMTLTEKNMQQNNLLLITFTPVKRIFFHIEVGHYIAISANMSGVIRSHQYNLIPKFPVKSLDEPNAKPGNYQSMKMELSIVCRTIPPNTFGHYVSNLEIGTLLNVSISYGTFHPVQTDDIKHLHVVTANTGITAVIGFILYMLQVTKVKTIQLLYFNRDENSILFRDGLFSMSVIDDRFTVKHILSKPSLDWRGPRGNISLEVLSTYIPLFNKTTTQDHYCAVCIYPRRRNAVLRWLNDDLYFPDYQIHSFTGE